MKKVIIIGLILVGCNKEDIAPEQTKEPQREIQEQVLINNGKMPY